MRKKYKRIELVVPWVKEIPTWSSWVYVFVAESQASVGQLLFSFQVSNVKKMKSQRGVRASLSTCCVNWLSHFKISGCAQATTISNHHLYTKFCNGQSEQCPCQTGSQTTEHLLQVCPLHKALRHRIWSEETPVARKLHGSLEDLYTTHDSIRVGVRSDHLSDRLEEDSKIYPNLLELFHSWARRTATTDTDTDSDINLKTRRQN
jgi:hypothetical protein